MKNEMKKTVIVSILALGLLAGPAFAQNTNTTQSQQQMNGNMMGGGMMGQGMQGGGMMGGGMMGKGMQGQGNWNNMGCNGMMGGAMMNRMTPNQQQSFMDSTTELRQKMIDLRFAYREAMRNPNTDPKKLAEIEKQMLDIRSQMMGKMEKMQTK